MWILFVILVGNRSGVAVNSSEFTTKAACEEAKDKLNGYRYTSATYCFRK